MISTSPFFIIGQIRLINRKLRLSIFGNRHSNSKKKYSVFNGKRRNNITSLHNKLSLSSDKFLFLTYRSTRYSLQKNRNCFTFIDIYIRLVFEEQHALETIKDKLKNPFSRSSHRRCSVKKDVLRNFTKFTRKCLCQSLCNFIKKETLEQVFSC